MASRAVRNRTGEATPGERRAWRRRARRRRGGRCRDQQVGRSCAAAATASSAEARLHDGEALLAPTPGGGGVEAAHRPRPPERGAASLQVSSRSPQCSRRISPAACGRRASREATSTPRAAAPPSAARKPQGIARWSGGGSKTWVSIATSICARSQPSPAGAARRPRPGRPRSRRTLRPPQRGADRGHRGELVTTLGDRDRARRAPSRRRQGPRRRLPRVADPGQVDRRDRAHGLRGLLVEVLDLRAVAAGAAATSVRRHPGYRSASRRPRRDRSG